MPNDSDILGNVGLGDLPGPTAPVAQSAPASPNLGGADPVVLRAIGETPGDPQSLGAWASTVVGRVKDRYGGFTNARDLITNPAGGYVDPSAPSLSWLAQKYPINSPTYQHYASILNPIISGQVPPPNPALRSYYSPAAQAEHPERNQQPFGDPSKGTLIGGNLYFEGYPGGGAPAPSAGAQAIASNIGIADANTPPASASNAPDTSGAFNLVPFGQNIGGTIPQNMTAAAAKTYAQMVQEGRIQQGGENVVRPGSYNLPIYVGPGAPSVETPGAYWVDQAGVEHVVPADAAHIAGSVGAGAVQGAVMDTLASGARLGLGGGDPLLGAISQAQGGPSAFDQYQAANEFAQGQQQRYAFAHQGDPYAQGGRFVGQMAPATAAAALTPEVTLPGATADTALGVLSRAGGRLATNALSGAAATAPSVGVRPENPLTQMAQGAAFGAVLPEAAQRAGILGSGLIGPQLSPRVQALADAAINKYNIPLRGSQIGGAMDPALAIKDSNLLTAPGSGFAANNRAQLQAFTRAVAGTFGSDADRLTPDVMSAARRDLGQKFDQFASSHSIPDTTQLHADLDGVLRDARQVLPSSELSPLENQVQGIKDLSAQNGGSLPGDTYQALTRTGAPLDRAMQSNDSNIRYYASQIHDALSDAMAQNATPEELADFANTRLQYKNLMTVKGLAAKANIEGAISPTQLQGVVNKSFDDRAFSGAGDLGELADIGQTFIKPPPNPLTAQRLSEAASRNALPAFLGAAAGGAEALRGVSHGLIGDVMHADPALAIQLGGAALATKGAQYGVNALAGLRRGPLAGRLLVGSPGAATTALSGLGKITKNAPVPASALSGLNLLNPTPVGAYSQ